MTESLCCPPETVITLLIVCACVRACSVTSVMFNSLWPHGLYPARLLCPWDYPGKKNGVGCHFLLQGTFLTQDQTHVSYSFCIGRWILYHWATWGTLLIGGPAILPYKEKVKRNKQTVIRLQVCSLPSPEFGTRGGAEQSGWSLPQPSAPAGRHLLGILHHAVLTALSYRNINL